MNDIGVESGYGNLIVELGIVGLLLWFVLGFSVSISCWKVVKSLRGTPWFPLVFAIGFYAFLMFIPMEYTGSTSYQDFVLNSLLWLLLGIMFRLRRYPEVSSRSTAPDLRT